ncbi:MAG: hypothetical protein AAFR17_11760 [Pseudomonadota bacterium]
MSRAKRALTSLAESGFPWAGGRRDPWSLRARRETLRRWPLALRPMAALAMAVFWPVSSLARALRLSRAAPYRPAGFWWKAWRAALTRNVPPQEFADYQLYRPPGREGWRFTRETALTLSRLTPPETSALIADKARLASCLAAAGVPVVPVLDRVEAGRSLVTKPRRGAQGRDVTAWIWTGERFRETAGFGGGTGREVSATELADHAQGAVIQPLIEPGLPVPAVARVITGPGAAHDALIQMPATGDFCSHRGPFRLIDLSDGRVCPPGPGQTGAMTGDGSGVMPLEGTCLPGWTALLDTLTIAHAGLLAPAPLIGWDVIWGAEGPLVLEGNVGIGFHLFQLDRLEPSRVPMPISVL